MRILTSKKTFPKRQINIVLKTWMDMFTENNRRDVGAGEYGGVAWGQLWSCW